MAHQASFRSTARAPRRTVALIAVVAGFGSLAMAGCSDDDADDNTPDVNVPTTVDLDPGSGSGLPGDSETTVTLGD